jgi:hypothetical protein
MIIIKYLTISSEQFEIDAKFQTNLHFERQEAKVKQKQKYSNKNESWEDIYKHLNHIKYFFYNDLFWKKSGPFW